MGPVAAELRDDAQMGSSMSITDHYDDEPVIKVRIHPTRLEAEAAEHIRAFLTSAPLNWPTTTIQAWKERNGAAEAWLARYDAAVDPRSQ